MLAFALAVAAPAQAAGPERQPIQITNASNRVAECALVVDGHTRTFLTMRPGKSHADAFYPGQDVRLVCERAKALAWPLKAGAAYRLVDGGRKIDLAEDAGE